MCYKYGLPLLFYLLTLSVGLTAESVVYLPIVETQIESRIDIGVKRTGSSEIVAITTRKRTKSDGGSNTTSRVRSTTNKIENTRNKTTNPNKRKSKPKPSGLFSGVARAIGGDYSGLASFAGGFVDHMMEPKYLWNVNKVYYTKDYNETTTTNTLKASWENTEEFETKITEKYKTDINKGFIQFSVSVRNIGERSIRIKPPNFIIHFLYPGEEKRIIGEVQTHSDNPEKQIVIASQSSHIFNIVLENQDIKHLSRAYRDAIGISVRMQNLNIIDRTTNDSKSIAERQEEIEQTHVRLDYYDGKNRSVMYIPTPPQGLSISELINGQRLRKSMVTKSPSDSNAPIDNFITSIGNLTSSKKSFSETAHSEKLTWRKWIITVADDLNTYYEPTYSTKIYPGHSIRIGYYAADQILPDRVFEPVIYKAENIEIKPNTPIHIPISLQKGDIIQFFDIQPLKFLTNTISFNCKPTDLSGIRQYRLPSGLSGGQLLTSQRTPEIHNYELKAIPFGRHTYYYLIEPHLNTVQSVPAESLIVCDNIDSEIKKTLQWIMSFQELSKEFTHVETAAESKKTFQPSIRRMFISAEQMVNTILLNKRSGESYTQWINRIIKMEGTFAYTVKDNFISKNNSYWVFPSTTQSSSISSVFATSPFKLPQKFTGMQISPNEFMCLSAIHDLGDHRGNPLIAPRFGPGFRPLRMQASSNRIYDQMRFRYEDKTLNLFQITQGTNHKKIKLDNSAGPHFRASIKVLRYTK